MAQLARRVLAIALALALLSVWASLPGAPVAAADGGGAIAEWCEVDPALVVRTPTGRVTVLHVTNYGLGVEHVKEVRRAEIRSTTRPVGGGPESGPEPAGGRREAGRPVETVLVEVVVEVPLGADGKPFPTRSAVSTGPHAKGTVLATATGQSGGPMRMEFRLDVR
jgi:hypothetical protein